jgi:hypothetical protein
MDMDVDIGDIANQQPPYQGQGQGQNPGGDGFGNFY